MTTKIFKVHTDIYGRLSACIKNAMYGITRRALSERPRELTLAKSGDIVFISVKECRENVLVGPFYIIDDRPPIVIKSRNGAWVNIDVNQTPKNECAYWVKGENRDWCLLFDKTLADRISVVWPRNWAGLQVNLPSWGLVNGDDAIKLLEFAMRNEEEAREFLKRHDVL